MVRHRQYRWLIAVGAGLIGGLILGGLWPHTPLYAIATDRADTFAMATGFLDSETRTEAVYFLDFLTGDLTAVGAGNPTESMDRLLSRQCRRRPGHRPAEKSQVPDGHRHVQSAPGRRQPSAAEQRHVLRGRNRQRQGCRLCRALVPLDVCRRADAKRKFALRRRHTIPSKFRRNARPPGPRPAPGGHRARGN